MKPSIMKKIGWNQCCSVGKRKVSYLLWDYTCADTFAPSFLNKISKKLVHASTYKKERKIRGYHDLGNQLIFIPVASETSGKEKRSTAISCSWSEGVYGVHFGNNPTLKKIEWNILLINLRIFDNLCLHFVFQ